ncbi:cobalamin biosynthesis protein [Candidatus Hodgkinia cicadicola]|nr:cobalamin biosynthesis protein [Candidatus Hodgkinia cicadicola]
MYWFNKIINKHNLHVSVLAMILEWFLIGNLRWSKFIHPISVLAHFIEWLLDTKYRYKNCYGASLNLAFVIIGVVLGYSFQFILRANMLGKVFEVLIVSVLLAHRCLIRHVNNILNRIYSAELNISRGKLAMIVGRNVTQAGENEICSVTILSLVENFCDATFSPLLYYIFLGLPGLLTYKIVELADSIYGNRRPENRVLGVWVANFDDILNYIPSRILGVMFLITFYVLSLGSYNFVKAYKDGYSLVSLNSALCEASVALYLGIKLNGNRIYGDVLVRDRLFNECGRSANGLDIEDAKYVINVVCLLTILIIVILLWFMT